MTLIGDHRVFYALVRKAGGCLISAEEVSVARRKGSGAILVIR